MMRIGRLGLGAQCLGLKKQKKSLNSLQMPRMGRLEGEEMEEYGINPDFKRYVDGYCDQYKVAPHEAVRHKLVQAVEEEYRNKRINTVEDGILEEDGATRD